MVWYQKKVRHIFCIKKKKVNFIKNYMSSKKNPFWRVSDYFLVCSKFGISVQMCLTQLYPRARCYMKTAFYGRFLVFRCNLTKLNFGFSCFLWKKSIFRCRARLSKTASQENDFSCFRCNIQTSAAELTASGAYERGLELSFQNCTKI